MSITLDKLYQDACVAQAQSTEARRIRTRVRDARSETTGAGQRWPFELLQNVHDAGPRDGQQHVNLSFVWDGTTLEFKHDGSPFRLQEVAALLSGGSSKEFESDETTGRFGTGFMVTHALACCIDITIAIHAEGQYEFAEIRLDRQGDEEAILANIHASHEAMKAAVPRGSLAGLPTASLRYRVDRPEAVAEGLGSLRRTLPYLFATCPKLGDVSIETVEGRQTWTAASMTKESMPHLVVRNREVTISSRDNGTPESIRVFAFAASDASKASLIAVVNGEGTPKIRVPAPGFPRLFARFPVRDTGSLPIPLILNAPFALSQERDKVHMEDADKAMITDAMSALPKVAQYATGANWQDAHRLCQIDLIAPADTPSHAQADWWNGVLSKAAKALSVLPLVRTDRGLAPAIIEENGEAEYHVDFVLPRFSLKDAEGPSLDRLWPLISTSECVDPPEKRIAREWNQIAESWRRLGVEVSCVGVAELVRGVRGDATTLDALDVRGDRLLWIARLIDLVGEWEKLHSAFHPKLLEGLLPDQAGALRSADALSLDGGVDPELKDLVERIGPRVKSRLLVTGLAEVAKSNDLGAFDHGLGLIVTRTLRTGDVISDAIAHLEKHAPDSPKVSAETSPLLLSTRALLEYLWRTQGAESLESARRLPLWARSGAIVRCSKGAIMMGPVAEWPADAQPFSDAYPQQRVLDDLYASAEGRESLRPAFIAWRLTHASPLIEESPAELNDKRLTAMMVDPVDTKGLTVSGARFSQIALLLELIPKAAVDPASAKALLGLALCHIARCDGGWRGVLEVTGRRAGQDVPCKVRRALWIGDLLYRAWLPAEGEDEKTISITASAAAIKPFLESSWLTGNDPAIDLLTSHFGFNPLELRITAAAADPVARAKLEEGLAALVQLAGADAGVYARMAEELVARKKNEADVDRNRTLGLAVQEVVRSCMESRGLKLTLIDHGYDYDVERTDGDALLDGSYRLGVGTWMMEVKATTSGDVRMTPTQAVRASEEPERYLLCVVDLRGLSDVERQGPWTTAIVEPRAKIFPGIGLAVAPTCELVTEAVENEVGIRNEKVLRYSVPPSVWEAGSSLEAWVTSLTSG